jgi:hypothetical protein
MNALFCPPRRVAAFAVAAAIVFSGCDGSKTYQVQVDAISQPPEAGQPAQAAQSYHIRTHNPQLDESSLRYKEVADYVRTALSGKGMYEAPSPDKADVVIDIDYGMDSPRVKFEVISTPIIVQKGGQVEQRTVMTAVRDSSTGQIHMVPMTVAVHVPSTTEFIGTRDTVQPTIVYEKYLKLSARPNQEVAEGRVPPEVWSVNVSAEDNSKELRKYMPILASATADYIGTNTKESKPVKIQEGDEVVTFIKKGM